ncbi:MAG: glycosyltransferase [Crocinitomicaceae bacterium]
MIVVIVIYLSLLIAAIFLLALSKSTSKTKLGAAKSVTVIIPFKNEAKRIQPLIASLNQSDFSDQIELIFVDDHSTDDTVNLILQSLDLPFRLLKLKETSGKKSAIAYGIQNATHEPIHTIDADVSFASDYLSNISKLPLSDLTILPVKLSGSSLFQQLNAIEFQWLQTFTFSLAKLKNPTLCNGANLSFSKSAFIKSLKTRTDFAEPSGDDIYLLEAVKKSAGNIIAFNDVRLEVQTPAPASFSSLISQRKRWIQKVLNGSAVVLILLYLLYNAVPFLALFKTDESLFWFLPLILKITVEFVLSNRLTIKQFLLTILHQVYYPIYGLTLLLSLPFKGKWK